jgi:hypothetical protein
LSIDTTGGLCITGTITGGNAAASATGSAVPASADYQAINVGGTLRGQTGANPSGSLYSADMNLISVNGVTLLAGAGNTGTGSPRVTIATDQAKIPIAYSDGTSLLSTDIVPISSNTAPIMSMNSATANGGLNAAMACTFDDASPQAVTENSFGFTRCSTNRNQYVTLRDAAGNERGANINASNQLSVSVDNTVTVASHAVTNAGTFAVQSTDTLATSGGQTVYNVEPGASDNHANIKNGAGQVYSVSAFSKDTVANYIRLYNAASGFNGCNSATNLVWSGIIPGASTGAGFTGVLFEGGLPFSTGISICVTGAYGQTSTTSATASVMEVNVGYK